MKATEYMMVKENNVRELEIAVDDLLDNGWELYAEPFCHLNKEGEPVFYQAMIKIERPE